MADDPPEAARHPADARDLDPVALPPGAGPRKRVFDALLVTTGGAGSFDEFVAHPPVGETAFVLGRDLVITKLGHDLEELIFNACQLRGHFFFGARQYGCRYVFVREYPVDEEDRTRWDPDNVIYEAVALSRLVHDNDHLTEYAARVVEYEGGDCSVLPFDLQASRYTFRTGEDRDWLDTDDAQALAALLKTYWAERDGFPRRVTDALWQAEHLVQERYLDVVLPGLVAALEGLVSSSTEQVTRQFTTRVPMLAAELGIEGVSRSFCRQMYEARSQGAHGSPINLFTASRQDEGVEKVARLLTVLRATIRRAIEDPAFRAAFEDDASVRARWPLRVRQRRRWARGPYQRRRTRWRYVSL